MDSRIRTLVENCHKLGHRSMFVIVGDKGRDQVVNLHYMLSKTVVKARPSVLWCYKKDLYLSRYTLTPGIAAIITLTGWMFSSLSLLLWQRCGCYMAGARPSR